MAAFKNKDNGTWYVQFRYTDWKGERQQKLKRGFATKREALEWEREFLMEKQADVNMTFESFVALYEKDIKPKLKLNTWLTKESIIKKKILPYFANRKLSEITAKDIIRWQNEIRELRDCHGKPLSKTYLKTVHNQLSAIFNHAARFYGLNINPARQAGNMGAEERKEMLFWTREEYTRFSEAMMDKPLSFYAFEVLYWCGVREGELLALTPADFDFEKRTVTVNKSYQRLNKQDVITTPKTPKSNRVIQMPQFLCDELQDYLKQLYGVEPDSRMFPISKPMENIQGTSCGRMSPARSVPIRVRTSSPSSKRSARSKDTKFILLDLRGGQPPGRSWQTISVSHGGYLMRSTGVFPNAENVSILSQILQAGVPEKYYLSPKACLGILRRASARGKELPELLRKALERQAASA